MREVYPERTAAPFATLGASRDLALVHATVIRRLMATREARGYQMLGRLGLALLWLGVAAFAIGSLPRGLANAGNQDQAQTIDNSQGTLGGAFSQTMAQTFQAGITGNL